MILSTKIPTRGVDAAGMEWPDCLGTGRYELPQAKQTAIERGEAALARLSVLVDRKKGEQTRRGKNAAVWEFIEEQGNIGDQKIARLCNQKFAPQIEAKQMKRFDAERIRDIRFEYTHPRRHRK